MTLREVELQVIEARNLYNRALVEKNIATFERAKALWANCRCWRWRQRNSLISYTSQIVEECWTASHIEERKLFSQLRK